MNPQMSKRELAALPWPPVRRLAGKDLCPYAIPQSGRRSLVDWLRATFDRDTPLGQTIHDQFVWLFMDIAKENVAGPDRRWVVPSDLPNGGALKQQYGPEEVAAWWNEAVDQVDAWRKRQQKSSGKGQE